jgi:hypothetical protein
VADGVLPAQSITSFKLETVTSHALPGGMYSPRLLRDGTRNKLPKQDQDAI